MPEQRYVELVTAAHEYLMARQDHLRDAFLLNNHERWDWNQDTAQLVFSTKGVPQVIADVRFVGSHGKKSGTWLWGWANDTLDHRLVCDLQEVRAYGAEHEIWQLTTPQWEGDETDGWEMTSISAYLLGAQGAYRTPSERGATFMLLDHVQWVLPEERRLTIR